MASAFFAGYVNELLFEPATAAALGSGYVRFGLVVAGEITTARLQNTAFATYQDLTNDGVTAIHDATHMSNNLTMDFTTAFVADTSTTPITFSLAANTGSSYQVVMFRCAASSGVPATTDKIICFFEPATSVTPNDNDINVTIDASGLFKLGGNTGSRGWFASYINDLIDDPSTTSVDWDTIGDIICALWPSASPPSSGQLNTLAAMDTFTELGAAVSPAVSIPLPASHEEVMTAAQFGYTGSSAMLTYGTSVVWGAAAADGGATFDYMLGHRAAGSGQLLGSDRPLMYIDVASPVETQDEDVTLTLTSSQLAKIGGSN